MGTLINNTPKIKEFEPISLKGYLTEADLKAIKKECESLSSVDGKSVIGRIHTKYRYSGGSKSGNTEIRIAGIILNMVNATKGTKKVPFNKADVARQLLNEGKEMSTRSVRRYLRKVLEKLEEFGVRFEELKGRGGFFRAWSTHLDERKAAGLIQFNPNLAKRTRRGCDLKKVDKWRKQNAAIKRGTKNRHLKIYKAKGETFNKDRVPDQMISLAAKIYKQAELGLHSGLTIPHCSRLQIDDKGIIPLLARRLTNGAFVRDALFEVFKDIEDTDRMMADVRLKNPIGYLTYKVKKRWTKNPDRSETLRKSRQYQREFHTNSIALYQSELAKESSEIGRAVIAGLIADHEEKIEALAA